jgi:hypothetical protein
MTDLRCPDHPESPTFWALFICDDGVYRCRACRDKRPPVVVPVPHRRCVAVDTTQRPYITKRGKAK